MPKIEIAKVPVREGSGYPPPFDEPCRNRKRWRLGEAAGLSQFGVNLLRLPPGSWSSQRHWHTAEDEFAWVLEGELVLVTDEGEQLLSAGECAGFAAGVRNGHHFRNRSGKEAVLLEIGSRCPAEDGCDYPDIDMIIDPGSDTFRHRDGRPYETERKRPR
jgi:uncharacterized cupin superfamily protein